MDSFITIKDNVQTEIIDKKSKFIANLFYIESVKEAEDLISKIKKEYFDARHNCIAFRVIEKDRLIENFGVDVSGVDIAAIELDKTSEGSSELM